MTVSSTVGYLDGKWLIDELISLTPEVTPTAQGRTDKDGELMSAQQGASQSDDAAVQRARELLRTNAAFRAALRRDPDAALQSHGIQLSEAVRQRLSRLDWNISDEEMLQRSNPAMPS